MLNLKYYLNPLAWKKSPSKSLDGLIYLDVGCRDCEKAIDLDDPNIHRYFGFDCDQVEIDRLNNLHANPNFSFHSVEADTKTLYLK